MPKIVLNGKEYADGGSPTWGKIAGDIGDQSDLQNMLNTKVDKVTGKGLSENDYTTAEKTKLAGIAAGAEVNVQANWNEADSTSDAFIQNKPSIPSKTSDLTNDSGFITGVNWGAIGGTLADQIDLNNELTALNTGLSSAVKSVNTETPDANGNVAVNAEDIPAQGYGNESTSGNPITITDGTPSTVKNLDVSLEPIQDLHGYDHPWPAGGGVNIFNYDGIETVTVEGRSRYGTSYTEAGTYALKAYNVPSDISARGYLYGEVKNADDSWGSVLYIAANANIGQSMVTLTTGQTLYVFDSQSDSMDNAKKRFQAYQFQVAKASTQPAQFYPYSNICPISGYDSVSVQRTGKNLFDKASAVDSKYIGMDGVEESTSGFTISDYIPVIGNAKYILSGILYGSPAAYHAFYDSNKTFISSVVCSTFSLTAPSTAKYVRLSFMSVYLDAVQLEEGTTATSYEPYQGNTATITLGQTVYQGTVDFDTGLMTVTHGIVDLGNLTWSYDTGNTQFYSDVISDAYTDAWKQVICSCYEWARENSVDAPYAHVRGFASRRLYVVDTNYTDADLFKASVTEQTVCYELATPLTVQLTPAQLTLLEGYNYITTDANSISMDYYGSEATNVQAEIAEFETSIDRLTGSLATIETSPATAPHAVGDLIVWNSQLYKVISAIAVGETITIGTNVSRTTIADELKAIIAQLGA